MNEREYQRSHPPPQNSIHGMIWWAWAIAKFLWEVFAAPFEVISRNKIGSRYQHIVTLVLAPVLPLILTVGTLMAKWVHTSHGLIGMGIFYLIYVAFTWKHYIHVIHMIIHQEKEENSYEDGEALPFIKQLPKGDKWPMVRFVYEPCLLIALAVVLTPLHAITLMVGGYLIFGAFAIELRAAFLFYEAWEYIRDALDNYNASLKMLGNGSGMGSAESIRRVAVEALSQVPKRVPRAVYNTTLQIARHALPPELKSMVDEAEGKPVVDPVAPEPVMKEPMKPDPVVEEDELVSK